MSLHIKVKFRAFGITFGQTDETIIIPGVPPIPGFNKVIYDRKGIFLRLFS